MTRARIVSVAVAVALALVVAVPAQAAYVSRSQPGNLELYGYHGKRISPTIRAWAGQQRCKNGEYRVWGKVDGDDRRLSVRFTEVYFFEEDNWYGPRTGTRGPSSGPLYFVGPCHPVTGTVQVKLEITARYASGASTGLKCISSYAPAVVSGHRYARRSAELGPPPYGRPGVRYPGLLDVVNVVQSSWAGQGVLSQHLCPSAHAGQVRLSAIDLSQTLAGGTSNGPLSRCMR